MKQVDWINNLFQYKVFNMKEYIKKSLAVKIKALRENANLTQEDLATKCNVSWRTISNLERGLVVPDLIMLIKIAQTFQTGLDNLIKISINTSKSKSRLEREQLLIEKIRTLNDQSLDFLLDELMLIFKHFN